MGEQKVKWVTNVKWLGGVHSDDCSLDEEVSARIRAARVAAKRMRPLLGRGRESRHMRGCIAMCFVALVASVLLHGSESWALTSAQLQRLEVFQRTCLRNALPRRQTTHRISNTPRLLLFKLPSISTMIARMQLRWAGHAPGTNERSPTARDHDQCIPG